MCTVIHDDLKDRDLVLDGFPINRMIIDAIQLFGELEDIKSFFALQTNERYNITIFPFLLLTSLLLLHFILTRVILGGLIYWSTIFILENSNGPQPLQLSRIQ